CSRGEWRHTIEQARWPRGVAGGIGEERGVKRGSETVRQRHAHERLGVRALNHLTTERDNGRELVGLETCAGTHPEVADWNGRALPDERSVGRGRGDTRHG